LTVRPTQDFFDADSKSDLVTTQHLELNFYRIIKIDGTELSTFTVGTPVGRKLGRHFRTSNSAK